MTADQRKQSKKGAKRAYQVRPREVRTSAAKDFWTAVVNRFELEPHEYVILRQVVSVMDRIAKLDAVVAKVGVIVKTGDNSFAPNPAAVESRQQQIVLGRLLTTLRLPEDWTNEQRPQRRGSARGSYGPRSLRSES